MITTVSPIMPSQMKNRSVRDDVHHVVILKHGITGNHKEMGYVKESLEKRFQQQQQNVEAERAATTKTSSTSSSLLVHSATCNDHNSLDGIEKGGLRLANEINFVLRDVAIKIAQAHHQNDNSGKFATNSSIALSIIGNSMGGLYARYALKIIDWIVRVELNDNGEENGESLKIIHVPIIPNVFVTTATPHLGVKNMTYWKVPEFIEPYVGWLMGQSVADLFRQGKTTTPTITADVSAANTIVSAEEEDRDDDGDENITNLLNNNFVGDDNDEQFDHCDTKYHDILEQMTFDPAFLDPLSKFRRRIAYANAYSTDIAVSTETAAFLTSEEPKTNIEDNINTTTTQSYLSSIWNCYSKRSNNDDDDENKSQDSMDHSLQLPLHVIEEEEEKQKIIESVKSSHFFVSGGFGSKIEGTHIYDTENERTNYREEEIGDHGIPVEYTSIRFDTARAATAQHYNNTRESSSIPASVSEMATNLDSLGWTKYFVDNRPHIPSLSWKTTRPNNNRRKHWEYNGDIIGKEEKENDNNENKAWSSSNRNICYSSSDLKKKFCPNAWDWNTLPFGHSFLIASTRDRIHEMLYRTARPFVDEVIVKEVIKEMLEL